MPNDEDRYYVYYWDLLKEVEKNIDNKRRTRDPPSTITNIDNLQRLSIFIGGNKDEIIDVNHDDGNYIMNQDCD